MLSIAQEHFPGPLHEHWATIMPHWGNRIAQGSWLVVLCWIFSLCGWMCTSYWHAGSNRCKLNVQKRNQNQHQINLILTLPFDHCLTCRFKFRDLLVQPSVKKICCAASTLKYALQKKNYYFQLNSLFVLVLYWYIETHNAICIHKHKTVLLLSISTHECTCSCWKVVCKHTEPKITATSCDHSNWWQQLHLC